MRTRLMNFHTHINKQNSQIQFTRDVEENGTLPSLDCLIKQDNQKLRTTVYRKPTYTYRLLDQSSDNPTSRKATTIKTLTRRAQIICDLLDALHNENNYLKRWYRGNWQELKHKAY